MAALQAELSRRTARLVDAEGAVGAAAARAAQLGRAAAAGEATLADVHADATRSYRAMVAKFEARVAELEAAAARAREGEEAAVAARDAERREGAAALRARDDTIARLHKRLEELAGAYGDALAETLRRLTAQLNEAPPEGGAGARGGADDGAGAGGSDLAAATLKKLQEIGI